MHGSIESIGQRRTALHAACALHSKRLGAYDGAKGTLAEALVRSAAISVSAAPRADSIAIADPDWESQQAHYRARAMNRCTRRTVITEPNRAGPTMAWPVKSAFGISMRCFMPGSMS